MEIKPDELRSLLRGDLIIDARAILDATIYDQFRISRIGSAQKRS